MLLFWRFNDDKLLLLFMVVLSLGCQNFYFCLSLNDEGLALLRFKERIESDPFGALSNWKDEVDACSWFGVECSGGNVVVLNLKDLCLKGTLAPDLGNLVHMKKIILRNNSLVGIIPVEIVKLKELETLDLGFNNFSGPLPSDLGNILSLTILLQDSNDLINSISPDTHKLKMKYEVQLDEIQLSRARHIISCNAEPTGKIGQRKLLQEEISRQVPSEFFNFPPLPPKPRNIGVRNGPSPSPTPSPSRSPPSPSPSSSLPSPEPSTRVIPSFSPPSTTSSSAPPVGPAESPSSNKHHWIWPAVIGGSLLLIVLVIIIVSTQRKKVAVVKPWSTGLSGQLQKAFVTGVPKLKRSEIETACEDFSNVIGSLSVGTLYKGTLSSGVEIAVVSLAVASVKDWSDNLETQFSKKIDVLSKVNHKNFVNLLGFCEEEEPFTRMIVFEYAPNGTLFEHLHIKEAEHLDWEMRMRIVMGIAYCLEHMHQMTPTLPHRNLTSSTVYLTEDYAAKISDFGFSNETITPEMEPTLQSNVYNFGVILFEMITGRLPFSVDSDSLDNWASDYLREVKHLMQMVDPMLESFQEEQLIELGQVMKACVNPDPELRPSMREVTARLRAITAIGPDGAIPKLSPLWWAELEILSTEAN